MILLGVAALAGGVFYFAPEDESYDGGEPGNSNSSQGAGTPGQSAGAPRSLFRDTLKDGSEGPEMIVIPAGQFEMGCVSGKECSKDELPVHAVTFDKPFAIGKYEVTFVDYDRFAEATGAREPDDRGWGRGSRPVIYVSWDDATEYAKWVSQQTGKRYRLPSDAEWEYATRAGTRTRWSFGNDETDLGTYAWYGGNSGGKTHPAGEKNANPWGMHDVHGNVWEWVQDCWHDSYEGAPDRRSAWGKEGGGNCGRRVVRGGSWFTTPGNLRSATRSRDTADYRDGNIGFRLAQDL